MDTVEEVRERLNARKGDWPAICEATGLKYDWMTKFAQGRIAMPGFGSISKLKQHLDQTETPPANDDDQAKAA